MSQKNVKLKTYLDVIGIPKLKNEQKMIVSSVLNKKDVIGVLPTGFGKSVCYVLPQLILGKTVFIVSPLISLIQDQQRKYKHVSYIMACHSNTTTITKPREDENISSEAIKYAMFEGSLHGLIYMTPENFMKHKHSIMKLRNEIGLIAIDECHCISTWSDFRDGYSSFYQVHEWFEGVKRPPILAVTGTATESTLLKVSNVLQLNNPVHIQLPPTRKNLALHVVEESNFIKCIKYIRDRVKGQVIIYCKTRKNTEKMAVALKSWGYAVGFYHAGLDTKTRTKIQDDFTSGTIQIMCATIAFGMGIDISNIETIIHYGLPKNLEAYCQEIGRAARKEELRGKCYIIWKKQDHVLNKMFIDNIKDPELRTDEWIKNTAMRKFIDNKHVCRMKVIHEYFKKKNCNLINQFQNCNLCDVCVTSMTTRSMTTSKYFS